MTDGLQLAPLGTPLITGALGQYSGKRVTGAALTGRSLQNIRLRAAQGRQYLAVVWRLDDGPEQWVWAAVKHPATTPTDTLTVHVPTPRKLELVGVFHAKTPRFGEAPGAAQRVQAPGLPLVLELPLRRCRGTWERQDGQVWEPWVEPFSGYATLPQNAQLTRFSPAMGQAPACASGSAELVRCRLTTRPGAPVDTYVLCTPERQGAQLKPRRQPLSRRGVLRRFR